VKSAYLSDKFATAMSYEDYLKTGTEEQQRRWKQVYESAELTDGQKQLIAGFAREMKLLIVSGIWCGDCVQQCPLIARIAEASPGRIELRLVDRDQHRDLAESVRINSGDRVPVVLFLAEDFELCGAYGDRTINRYRAFAKRLLGPACPTGIVAPDAGELSATLGDWLTEIERVQLMLRLSPRLRQKHGD
jgi:thioredoxin-like negative regulator of GroEL